MSPTRVILRFLHSKQFMRDRAPQQLKVLKRLQLKVLKGYKAVISLFIFIVRLMGEGASNFSVRLLNFIITWKSKCCNIFPECSMGSLGEVHLTILRVLPPFWMGALFCCYSLVLLFDKDETFQDLFWLKNYSSGVFLFNMCLCVKTYNWFCYLMFHSLHKLKLEKDHHTRYRPSNKYL